MATITLQDKKLPPKKPALGFSLMEVMVAIGVVGMLVVTILSVFHFALKTVAENKARTGAVTLAEERIELVRNLPYDSVGVIGGIPSGSLAPLQTTLLNNVSYTISVQAVYIDDPFDGTVGGNPADLLGNDYKKVRVAVSWTGHFGPKTYVTITSLTPRGIETNAGGGTLSLLVFDANGVPVPQATLTVANASLTPPINLTVETNDQGRYLLPGAPASINRYRIAATKAGYSLDQTCAIDAAGNTCTATEGNPTPTKPHATVVAGELTEVALAIDRVSTLVVNTIRQSTPGEWAVNTGGGSFDQDNPAPAVCPNGNYLFVWRDYRQNNNPRIYAQQYDANKNPVWNPDLALTASNNQNNPDVAVDAECHIYVAWNDDRNGNQDIYFDRYTATGTDAWGGAKKVNVAAQNADQTFPQVVVNASATAEYLVWQDASADAGDIYARKFDPAGTVVWASEVRINSDIGTATQSLPAVALDADENLLFLWHDNRNGNNDIFAQKFSPDGVRLWSPDKRMNTDSGASEQIIPAFALGGAGTISAVWEDYRNGNADVYAQRYDANGTPRWGQDVRVNGDAGTSAQGDPSIASAGDGTIWIVWEDNRNGTNDIYLQKLATSGEKLLPADVRVNGGTAGEQENPELIISPSGKPVVIWQDNGSGNYDIRAAIYDTDPQTITPVGSVTFFLTGAKRIGENPILLKYSQSHTTGENGQLTIPGLEWDTYGITPVGYAIRRAEPNIPVALAPNTTLTVTLNLQ